MKTSHQSTRREFLKLMGKASLFGAAAPLATSLLTSSAMASTYGFNDYRALVCIFLYGGNDCHNTIIPVDQQRYDTYAKLRRAAAVPYGDLAGTYIDRTGGWGNGQQMALHPNLSQFKGLFDRGDLGVVMNVGTLKQPTSRDNYSRGRSLPPNLFSHNDQFTYWQSMQSGEGGSGWGGRLVELMDSLESKEQLLSMVTTGGQSTFSEGNRLSSALVSPSGPVGVRAFNPRANPLEMVWDHLKQPSPNLLSRELARQTELAYETRELLEKNLEGTQASLLSPVGDPEVVGSQLHAQLNMVARLLQGRASHGLNRQVFFCSLGGFDTHGGLMDVHPQLLKIVADAMTKFQDAVDDLGLGDNVVTFTASDFGRSLTSNGRGSDHGWGGHHFVMGKPVLPQAVAGVAPSFAINGPDDAGFGRLIPAVSVDQYAATLATWMGVSAVDLPLVSPNLEAFDQWNLELLG